MRASQRRALVAVVGGASICLLLGAIHGSRPMTNRTADVDVRYQFVDPQQANGAVPPQYDHFGTDLAFLDRADGSGQSTLDQAHFQQLAAAKAKGRQRAWKPLAAEQLFHRKGVRFKGFNHKKGAAQRRAKQEEEMQQRHVHQQRQQKLWVQPDNGVYTTINVRGMADPEGGIQYNSNFVYGPPGTPQQQPDPVSDQWWRYTDTGYKTLTGPSTGGSTPNYEMINVGPMESDGSEWGYVPSPATPVYNYFPSEFYPSSSAYNYPASVNSEAVGKQAYIFSNGQGTGAVHQDGTIGDFHQDNSYGPGLNWDVTYNM